MATSDLTNASANSLAAPIMIGSAGVPGIEKLEGHKNYDNWKFQMRMILIDYGLWKCVMGQDQDADRESRALAKIFLAVKPICVSHI